YRVDQRVPFPGFDECVREVIAPCATAKSYENIKAGQPISRAARGGGMIFSGLKEKSSEPTRGELFARTLDLGLPDMLEMLTSRMAGEAPADRAMVLIAFANARSELKASKSVNISHATSLPT